MATSVNESSITFAACVEAGALEPMTVRLAESLRKFGGKFADAPIIAVNPRLGVPLAKSTLKQFEHLNVTYRQIRPTNRYRWNSYINKPLTLIDAERIATTPSICWLDSDVIILGEPTELALNEGEDFAACAPDKNIGTDGSDEHAPYWRELCKIFGLNLDHLPWITTHRDQKRIRLYFNSGVFTYRKSTAFGTRFLNDCYKLLNAKIASHESGIFFTDQVSLVLTMLSLQLKWRALPHEYNYAMGSKIQSLFEPAKLRATKVLHYHDAMWPQFWPTLLPVLKENRPEVHDWLAPMGPLKIEQSLPSKVVGKLLQKSRKKKMESHRASCKVL